MATTRQLKIAGLGEVLWDVFPDGARFGGAPANFACSAAGLAGELAQVFIVSAVGEDELGAGARQALAGHDVETRWLADSTFPTGQVDVRIDDAGHATYEFAADTAWDHLEWTDELNAAAELDAVCFGTLGQRSETSRETIRRFLAATSEECLRIFDVNLRPPFWSEAVVRDSLPLANVLKCNEDELPVLASIFQVAGTEQKLLRQLIDRFSLRAAALTRGSAGSLLLHESGDYSDLPGVPAEVTDTVGAGDAFTATFALGLLLDRPLAETHEWASRVAAFVCSQPGATPRIPTELRS